MKVASEKLITDLIERTRANMNRAEKFNQMDIDRLNFRNDENSWSILECFEHLNLYGDFYIPEIETSIKKSRTPPATYFTPGLLGNYFAKSMLPKKKLNRMKTFKDKDPIHRTLDKKVIDCFISQQKQLLELLESSRNIDLNRTKTAISISKLIRLKIGDTYRVVISHNERHIVQADNVLAGKTGR